MPRPKLASALILGASVTAIGACTQVLIAPGTHGAAASGSGAAGGQGGAGAHGGAGGLAGAGGVGGATPVGLPWQVTAAGQVQDVSVAVDVAGNIIVAGNLLGGTIDLGGGPLTSAQWGSVFAVKLDPDGHPLWSRAFDNANIQSGLAVDGLGDILLAGRFIEETDLGGGTLTSAGASAVFVAKLDPEGKLVYGRAFGDASHQDASGIAVDAAGNAYVAGTFDGTVDFGGGPLGPASGTDVFVAALDPSGQHLWSRRFGGDDYDRAGRIAVTPDGHVALTGTYQGTPDLGGGPLPESTGPFDWSFLLALDATGYHVASSGNRCRKTAPVLDAAGHTMLACAFTGDVNFGADTLSSGYFIHLAVARFDAGQTLAWDEAFGDVGATVYNVGAAPAGEGSVLIAGHGTGSLDFGGGQVLGGDHLGGFVAWLDATGDHVWSRGFNGDGDLMGTSAALTPAGAVVFAGTFTGTVDLIDGPTTSAGPSDLFVVKIVP